MSAADAQGVGCFKRLRARRERIRLIQLDNDQAEAKRVEVEGAAIRKILGIANTKGLG